jgi:hypothetical protein
MIRYQDEKILSVCTSIQMVRKTFRCILTLGALGQTLDWIKCWCIDLDFFLLTERLGGGTYSIDFPTSQLFAVYGIKLVKCAPSIITDVSSHQPNIGDQTTLNTFAVHFLVNSGHFSDTFTLTGDTL